MYIIFNDGYTGTVYWTGTRYSIYIREAKGYISKEEAQAVNKGRVIKVEYT